MRRHLTHVQAGVLLLHGIYLQPPIVRVLKPNADPGVATVRVVAHRQQGHLVRGLSHPHNLHRMGRETSINYSVQVV